MTRSSLAALFLLLLLGAAGARGAGRRLLFRADQHEAAATGHLRSPKDHADFRFEARAGRHLVVRVEPVDARLVTAGLLIYPSGKSDGGPGGIVFDSILDETGTYRVRVLSRENTAPGSFRLHVELR